jgi:hypothetical protein
MHGACTICSQQRSIDRGPPSEPIAQISGGVTVLDEETAT